MSRYKAKAKPKPKKTKKYKWYLHNPDTLTAIWKGIRSGMHPKDLATQLGISYATVRKLAVKLGLSNPKYRTNVR